MKAKKILATGLAIVLVGFLGIMAIVTPVIIIDWAKTAAPHTEYRWAEVEFSNAEGVLFRDTDGEGWYWTDPSDLDPNGFYALYIDNKGTDTYEDDEIIKIFQER